MRKMTRDDVQEVSGEQIIKDLVGYGGVQLYSQFCLRLDVLVES